MKWFHVGVRGVLSFLQLHRSNVDALGGLTIAASQQHLLAPNSEWIAQAAFNPESITFGVFQDHDQKEVGMISLIDPRLVHEEEDLEHFQQGCLYVWRLMIADKFQGKGYGKLSIEFAQAYAKAIGLGGVSLTTMDKEKDNALPFYQRLGFQPTGRRLDDEIELIWRQTG
ncbi:GNAT family N-acetyltransferase [Pseudahrensia aquimaris]|uniref:GNAT family N-acetyltransferase n=1 Tax=Pseudahrensia aquimaris TaxID=744461 RepID=A0ABW3FK35_9HYPH